MKASILLPLESSELEQCIYCIKRKFAKKTKKDAKRSAGILEIIHTDICGPFLRSADPLWPSSWTFCEIPYENGIVAQYSTPDEPQQNGVAETRNRTLMDMIRSMNYGQEENPRLITFVCGAVQ